jgi:hypothetical protein
MEANAAGDAGCANEAPGVRLGGGGKSASGGLWWILLSEKSSSICNMLMVNIL